MADPRAELAELEELERLEAKAGGKPSAAPINPLLSGGLRLFGGLVKGGPLGMGAEGLKMGGEMAERVAYDAGGAVTDLTGSPAAGYVANVATQAIPTFISGIPAKAAGAPVMAAGAERLMRSALKPNTKDVLNGDAMKAIRTLLDEGVNVTPGGAAKLRNEIDALNEQISAVIKSSPATVNKDVVAGYANSVLDRFRKQVNPNADTAAIRASLDEFVSHPLFANMGRQEAELAAKVSDKAASKTSALQDAGRFATTAAQQEALANAAVPVAGMPRVPARVTNYPERVGEANSAYHDALVIAQQRAKEKEFLEYQLEALKRGGPAGLPVQTAQEMKQGTYRVLKDKYGEIGSASTEAQKALARGLKDEIARVAPEVAQLNARESSLLNALQQVEHRAAVAGNKNPGGLAWLSSNPTAWASFMADRSELFKSIVARMIYSGREQVPAAVARTGTAGITAAQNE